jgi:hypothetical protein
VNPAVLFVGESPPPGAAADFRPFDCASGTRLARNMLGLVDRAALLEHVPMVNLFDRPTGPKGTPAWSDGEAMDRAMELLSIHCARGVRSFVLLGSRVAAAFNMGHLPGPASVGVRRAWPDAPPPRGPDVAFVRVPHPSGASTALNSPEVVRDVRRLLLPELVLGCPTLRPWHFRLDDPAVLEDLALAVAPLRPSAGLVALEWAASQHKARLASPPGSLLARIAAEAAKGCDGAELVIPAWDEPLARIAVDLLRPDGVEALSVRWDPGGGPKPTVKGRKSWLAGRILEAGLDHWKDVGALAVTPTARATVLRYALGGLGSDGGTT